MIKKITLLTSVVALLSSCCNSGFQQVATTDSASWIEGKVTVADDATTLAYEISLDDKGQVVDGFGACFNELGWTSLSLLTPEDREVIISELFTPNTGANFNICRMPVAANDFSTDWYSYNETAGDFEMENFSIDHDRATLIPFIHAAQVKNPELMIWGSPWCPPSWFKDNGHYACKTRDNTSEEKYHNGLNPKDTRYEGQDTFIQDPKYLEAYALYFEKYIKAYREENIDIFAVMPQNEFNSSQIFPSCLWQAKSLGNFVGKHLGPRMSALGVDILIGTVERPDDRLVDTMLNNPDCRKYVSGVGFQWGGKGSIPAIQKNYPDMKLYQTEQECGNGKNDWEGVVKSWDLLKHYFDHGVSAYMYWNISLVEGGFSRWGWAQNSLVVVDPTDNSYRFTPEYYLMKHISHFVKAGANYIATPEGFEGLVFENPNGEIVVLYAEKNGEDTVVNLTLGSKQHAIAVQANSINTIVI